MLFASEILLFYLMLFSSRPYQFRMEEIEAFRYRSQDAWKAVTRIAVREARLGEIKSEMMQSKKLRVS